MSAELSGEISNVDTLPLEALGFLRFARRLMCMTSPQREGETSRFSRNDISPGYSHSSLSQDLVFLHESRLLTTVMFRLRST